jgi:signal transduction histidine kinase/ActR/RegA family two-component response regulator
MDVLNPVTDKSMDLYRIRKSSLGTADSIRKRLGFGSPNDESFGWRMLVLSRVGCLLLLIAAVGTIVLALRSADAEKWVQHSLDVRSQARELYRTIQDAIIRERGFLLTADPQYLGDFDELESSVVPLARSLQTLVADNPEQVRRLADIEPKIAALRDSLQGTVALVKNDRKQAAVDVVRSNHVLDLNSDVRKSLDAFISAEQALLTDRQERAALLQNLLLFLIGLSLVLAGGLSVFLGHATRHFVQSLRGRTADLEAEIQLRRVTEDTLRQAQKMEAIGQLTGGISHDFNNLLTVIIGNLDTVKRQLAKVVGENVVEVALKLQNNIDMAMQAARNAAKLTQRLLAFARRQTLDPARLDCNRLISGMSELLHRTLGETVNLEVVLGGGLWPAFTDANQLESALLNLALNARQAMPDGGRLTIETANAYLDEAYVSRFGDLEVGQYVQISVADTGVGIPPEILDRVFEPFFTTKSAEAGSGLGLAMVHGFVKQSGGHVRIYSEVGHGTTVKIYLPRLTAADEVAANPAGEAVVTTAMPRACDHETILVVEDNDEVRAYAKSALEELGFQVIEAATAEEGLRSVENGARIDLLFTDVVLPGGFSGRQLSDKVLKLRPSLPVLFTTGYTRNAIVHHGRLDPGVELLNKPYTQQDLARKIGELLGRSRKAPGST